MEVSFQEARFTQKAYLWEKIRNLKKSEAIFWKVYQLARTFTQPKYLMIYHMILAKYSSDFTVSRVQLQQKIVY